MTTKKTDATDKADQHDKDFDFTEKITGGLDEKMTALDDGTLVKKFLSNSIVKSIMDSSLFKSFDKAVSPHFDVIMKVIGVLALIGGVIGLFGLLGALGLFFGGLSMFGAAYVVMLVTGLVGSVLAVVQGYGILAKKGRIPFLLIIGFFRSIISIILNQLFRVGSYKYAGYAGGNSLLGIILGFVVLLLVLKNRKYFAK